MNSTSGFVGSNEMNKYQHKLCRPAHQSQRAILAQKNFSLENKMCWQPARNSTCEHFHLFLLLRGYSHLRQRERERERNDRRGREENFPNVQILKTQPPPWLLIKSSYRGKYVRADALTLVTMVRFHLSCNFFNKWNVINASFNKINTHILLLQARENVFGKKAQLFSPKVS